MVRHALVLRLPLSSLAENEIICYIGVAQLRFSLCAAAEENLHVSTEEASELLSYVSM